MKSIAHVTCLAVSATFTALALQAAQQKPTFRARVELMQLDVTVLGKDGRPVRGLTKEDFQLFEDDKAQSIEGFTAIDVPDAVAGPPWIDKAVRDVTSNQLDNQRIFVVVVDDGKGIGLLGKREIPDGAADFIGKLGPKDLAAVVFTGTHYRQSQNLTTDHARLIKAIRNLPQMDANLLFPPVLIPPGSGANPGLKGIEKCLAHKEILRLMEAIVDNLGGLRDRRKSIVYFGAAMPWEDRPGEDVCGTYWLWRNVFAAAQEANVSINPFFTGISQTSGYIPDSYRAVADYTGGRAFDGWEIKRDLERVRVENSSYYLLAYQPTRNLDDGTFRRISVKVNRPDVEVRTRRNYWAPRVKVTDPEEPKPSPQIEALASILPLSKLPLRATAAPFAIAGSQKAAVAIALGVQLPPLANREPERIELLLKAYTADGDELVSDTQTVSLPVPAARPDADLSRYEVLARVEIVKPGKYELRVSAHSDLSDTRGSVYVDVDVPDFRKEKVSFSGLVVNSIAALPVAPVRLLNDLSPMTPTTERTFASTDLVTTYMRVYQGGNDKQLAMPIKIRIADEKGSVVFEQTDTIAPDRFGAVRAADYQFRVPLAKLAAGQHLLTFEASVGKTAAKRDVIFVVK